jgi:hypothetical protein
LLNCSGNVFNITFLMAYIKKSKIIIIMCALGCGVSELLLNCQVLMHKREAYVCESKLKHNELMIFFYVSTLLPIC